MILLDPDLETEPTVPGRRRAGGGAMPAATSASRTRVPELRREKLPGVATLARFLAEARGAVRLRGTVSVLLTTDAGIRRLNRQFRGVNKATDVLSFPAGGPAADEVAGDLAISVPTARRQATACGHSLGTELKVLMLHGLLHLAGYDHETDGGEMARRERLLRGRLGLPQGLIERAGSKEASEADKMKVRRSAGAAR